MRFHYHGKPVSAQDAIDMLRNRAVHRQHQQDAARRRDEREGTIWRQLLRMIRGRS